MLSLLKTASADSSIGIPGLIAAEDLSVRFRDRIVLDRVSLTIEAGEIVTLLGLNGSGKSTLVRALLGLIRPDGGRVRRAPGLRIGYAPQSLAFDPTLPLTVSRFLGLGSRRPEPGAVAATLAEVGAQTALDRQMSEVSGGELHRILLARALMRKPNLLVLDEPMAGVDVNGQAELYALIARLRDRLGCGVLLVSHDLHLVMAQTDRVICLNHHVCCTGQPHAVVREPAFAALFGQHLAQSLAVYHHHHDHDHDGEGRPVPVADEKSPVPVADEKSPVPVADGQSPVPVAGEKTPVPVADSPAQASGTA